MTTLTITGTLMNNYASITLLGDNFYDAYLDNQFSLKADVSQLAGLVTSGCLELKYTNSVGLATDCFKKADIDNMLLSYSTGSYVDCSLANKVSTTGDASISPNLTINGNMDSSKKFSLDIKSSTIHTEFWTLASFHQGIANSGAWLQFSRDGTSNTWQSGMSSDNPYVVRTSDATNVLTVNQNGNTSISGNLESQSLALNKPSNDDDIPLQIINNNQNWFVASLESTIAGDGCLVQWMTPASSSYWWSGVWGTNTNDSNIWFNDQGLYHLHNGSAVLSGNLNVGPSQAQSSVNTYFNHVGSTGYMMKEGRYRDQGFLHFGTNYQYGEMF